MSDNINIFPEKIVHSVDSRGKSYFSEIYTLDTWRDLGFIAIILLCIVIGLIAPALCVLLFIFYCIDAQNAPYKHSLFAIGFSIYYILDVVNHWFISLISAFFYSAVETGSCIILNMVFIIVHLILLTFGPNIFELSGRNKFVFLLICLGLSFVSYFFAMPLINDLFKIKLS